MRFEQLFEVKQPRSVCVGTGLLALDVILNGNSQAWSRVWAGGSCGNVLTILSYLGWKTYPIARLGQDKAGKTLLNDLSLWKVETDLIFQDLSDNTPIIIEQLKKRRDGMPQHRFQLRCPICKTRLPRYRAITVNKTKDIATTIPQAHVFYFDRVRRSAIELVKLHKACGALIFFEPSSIGDEELFLECLQLADVVKYSNERLKQIKEITCQIDIPIEIETLNAYGLRYRLGNNEQFKKEWGMLTAYPVNSLVDPAGSGDWCSAGIIHLLGNKGREGLAKASREEIENALNFGQALATLNCYYEGARGGMYSLSKQRFVSLIEAIMNADSPTTSVRDDDTTTKMQQVKFEYICPNCINKETMPE